MMAKFKIGDSVRLQTDRSETMAITGYRMIHPPPVWKNGVIISEDPPYTDETNLSCLWHDKEVDNLRAIINGQKSMEQFDTKKH